MIGGAARDPENVDAEQVTAEESGNRALRPS